jgi:membrane protease YdiL (CAAX protease family)
LALSEKYALPSLPVAFFLWYVTFQVNALSFWDRISLSTVILLFISLSLGRSGMRLKPSGRALSVGVVSAILLYLFFWSGFQVLKGNSTFIQQVSSVYLLRTSGPSDLIFLLLLFPIGPAEETYWRGLIQKNLQAKMSGGAAIIVTSVLYSLIHLPTLNPSLIFVALVGGLVWGYLFKRYNNDLVPCLVSHILFDELVFVVLPLG